MSTTVEVNVATHVALQISDGDTGLFPQVTIYDSGGSVVSGPVDLVHVANGLYTRAATFSTVGGFDLVFITFTDGLHLFESSVHGRVTERFTVVDNVWAEALPGSFASGTAGFRLADVDARIPSVLIGGRMAASVEAVSGSVVDVLTDAVWDEDIVAAHGTADTTGLLVRALGAAISQRANNPTLDSLLGVSDSPGATVVNSGTSQIDVVQAWTRSISPSTLHAVVFLRENGERVTLPGAARLEVQAYDQAGSVLFTQSAIVPTIVGADTWFGVDQVLNLAAGAVISIRATVTDSGIGGGTHNGITQIVTPEF